MQIEDVAGIRLAAGRAAQQQRQLAIGLRVLAQIVVHQQRVLAAVAKIFAHRAAAVRRDVLQRSGFGSGRGDDGGELHRARAGQLLDHLRDGRALLPDRHVDAVHVEALLIDDRVDRDRGLAGLAIADDQLALSAPDNQHRVDGLDAGLQRLLDRLAADDTGRLDFDSAHLGRFDRALVVDRLAEGVDDAAEQALADRNFGDSAGALDLVAFLDGLRVAEEHGADVVLFEVQHQAVDLMRKFEQLAERGVLEAVDSGDTVAAREDAAGFADRDTALKTLDFVFEDFADF